MGPDNLVTHFVRNNDSSNPYLLLSKKKQTPVRMSVFSWQRYKNLNASVQNLVTRSARNNDSNLK